MFRINATIVWMQEQFPRSNFLSTKYEQINVLVTPKPELNLRPAQSPSPVAEAY